MHNGSKWAICKWLIWFPDGQLLLNRALPSSLVHRAQIDASSPVVRHGGDSATARWIPCSRAGFPCANRWDRGKWFVSEIELWSLCYVKLNLFQYSVWPFLFHSSSRYQSVSSRYQWVSSRYSAGSPIRQSIDHISQLTILVGCMDYGLFGPLDVGAQVD